MKGTLVLTSLSVQSSYLSGAERSLSDRSDVPDTIQWWIAQSGSWRIKTFAIDHDIHTHMIGYGDNLREIALANDRKNYCDVLQAQHVIEFNDVGDDNETNDAFESLGLVPHIEIAAGQFAFWKPDNKDYFTQSEPE